MKAGEPPVIVALIAPLVPWKQVTFVATVAILIAGGELTTRLVKVAVQEFASVTVTAYVPGAKLNT